MATLSLSIRCFGGVAIERDGVPIVGRSTQRRRLAVLLLLATARDHPVSRDRIMALLWPESEPESARHLLSGAVYELRRAFGESAILSRGEDLWLDPKVAPSDVAEFEAFLAGGTPDKAVELYRGAFADGFHVGEAPEFERWLEQTRHGYRRMFHEALETIAAARTEANDPRGAAEAWLRLAAEDPADARVVINAMRALDAAGNRAGALRQAGVYEAYLRAEFDTDPDPQVLDLTAALRRSANSGNDSPASPPPGLLAVAPPAARRHRPSTSAQWLGSAVAVALILGAAGRFVARSAAATDSAGGTTDAPFVSTLTGEGTISPDELKAIENALRASLDGVAGLAGLRVDGSIHEAGGRLRARAALLQSDGRRIGEASADGASDRPFELVDAMAIGLVAARWARPSERFLRAAARSTRSLEGLKAFLAGESDRRAGRFAAAAEAFGRAVVADSTFALAHYRLSMTTLAADLPLAKAAAADSNAMRHAGRLEEPERLLLQAYDAFRRGDAESAEQIYRGLVGTYPDDVEAWRQLGETFFHYNPLRGRSIAEARVPFERVLKAEPKDWDALWHLAQVAANEGRRDVAVKMLDALLTMAPGVPQSVEVRTLRALAARDSAAEAALSEELSRADELLLHQIVWRTSVYLRDIEGGERIARFMVTQNRPRYSLNIGHQDLASLRLARGQWRAGTEELLAAGAAFAEARVEGAFARAAYALQFIPPRPRAELVAIREGLIALEQSGPRYHARRFTLLGLTNVALSDTVAARAVLAEMQRRGLTDGASTLRAALARARGDVVSATRAVEPVFAPRWFGIAVTNAEPARTLERFMYAELLREGGRAREAIGWYASFEQHAPHDLPFLAPSHWRRAEIFQQAGDWKQAAAHYSRVAELWRDCDPEFRAVRDEARARADSLRRHGPRLRAGQSGR